MTDTILAWATGMSALAGLNDAANVSMILNDGTVLEYEVGDGLTIIAGARKAHVPEEALEQQRWAPVDPDRPVELVEPSWRRSGVRAEYEQIAEVAVAASEGRKPVLRVLHPVEVGS